MDNISSFMNYEKALLLAYGSICAYLSINPVYKTAWWMENITVWVVLAVVIYQYTKGLRLSKISYSIICLGVVIHTIGGHYTFQNVPIGESISNYLGLARNYYDRLGHFLCGCFVYPLIDFALKKHWFHKLHIAFLFQLALIMGIAAMYEIFEWLCILYTEESTGLTFVGAQGDVWDAQADMLSCFVGGCFSMLLFFLCNRSSNSMNK